MSAPSTLTAPAFIARTLELNKGLEAALTTRFAHDAAAPGADTPTDAPTEPGSDIALPDTPASSAT